MHKHFIVWHFVLLGNITAVTTKYTETMKPLLQRIKETSGEIYSSILMNQFSVCLFIIVTAHMGRPEALSLRRKLRLILYFTSCHSWFQILAVKSDNFAQHQEKTKLAEN